MFNNALKNNIIPAKLYLLVCIIASGLWQNPCHDDDTTTQHRPTP